MTTDPIAVRRRFCTAMVKAMGADPARIDAPGTTVVADDRRRPGSVACYRIGRHTFVPFGAGLGDEPERWSMFNGLHQGPPLADAEFREMVEQLGGRVVGGGVMKTRTNVVPTPPSPGRLHVFDWQRSADLEIIETFVAQCEPDDLDEADLDLDRLDTLAVGLLDEEGRLMAYSSSQPYEEDDGFGDIAVITHADARRGGWGRASVGALIDTLLLPNGIEPLYRCDVENAGSDRLSSRLGFTPALTLTAAQFFVPEH